MANLKNDIVNELRNEKYYLEQDLVRLVNGTDSSVGYKERIHEVKEVLAEISQINQSIGLLEAYMPTQQETPAPAPAPADGVEGDIVSDDVVTADGDTPVPQAQPQQGQTHAE